MGSTPIIATLIKIDWPNDVELGKLVFEMPLTKLGKRLGVTLNSIKNRCKKRGISLPHTHYWQQKKLLSNAVG